MNREKIENDMCNYYLTQDQATFFQLIEEIQIPPINSPEYDLPTSKQLEKAKKLCGILGPACVIQPLLYGVIELHCDGIGYLIYTPEEENKHET